MITDHLSQAHLYYSLSERIQAGLLYLQSAPLSQLNPGDYNIQGDDIIAKVMEYETREEEGAFLEGHKKYLDIQFIISGKEMIGYTPLNGQTITSTYNEKEDYAFYKGEYSKFLLAEHQFAIFFPADLHKPGLNAGEKGFVKKVVLKITV